MAGMDLMGTADPIRLLLRQHRTTRLPGGTTVTTNHHLPDSRLPTTNRLQLRRIRMLNRNTLQVRLQQIHISTGTAVTATAARQTETIEKKGQLNTQHALSGPSKFLAL
jgi:hypothetical protein